MGWRFGKNPSRKIILLNHRRAPRPASPETIFSIDYWSIPCSTKKNWSKNIIPAWRTIHSNAATDHAKWGKFDKKIPKNIFFENSMNISKNQKFWFLRKNISKIENFNFSKFSLNFRRKYFWDFFVEFPPFCMVGRRVWVNCSPSWNDIFAPGFLCYKVWTSTLWKKLSRTTRGSQHACGWASYFFVTDFSESTFHLPGERELRRHITLRES